MFFKQSRRARTFDLAKAPALSKNFKNFQKIFFRNKKCKVCCGIRKIYQSLALDNIWLHFSRTKILLRLQCFLELFTKLLKLLHTIQYKHYYS